MSSPNYRVHVSFDGERKVFVARVPELPACLGEGATRGEALVNMERELEALVATFVERGGRPPLAVDDEPVNGQLDVQVSRGLHRELLFAARAEGVELPQLVSELLASGLEHRQRRAGRRPSAPEAAPDNSGNQRGREPGPEAGRGGRYYDDGGRRGERNTAARFHGLLEDRASFMEYVRGVEAEGRGATARGGFGGGGGDRGRRSFGPGGGRRPEGRPDSRDEGRGPRGGGAGGGTGGGSGGGSGGGRPGND